MGKQYVIGLDYGTKSGRAVLADAKTGDILTYAVKDYTHGVMDEYLPDHKTKLGVDWVLQHPGDYLEVLEETIPNVLKQGNIDPDQVIGISIDFTASTILPVDRKGRPLCMNKLYQNRPHAYVKLWKHHGAQEQANIINQVLTDRGEINSNRYGGKISSELLLPKVFQIIEEDPEIFEAADQILEAADWLNQILTGEKKRSGSTAGYKAMWNEEEGGYPPSDFFEQLHPGLKTLVDDKLKGEIAQVGTKIGELNQKWALKLGLPDKTPVGVSIIDAHAGLPGCGITKTGQMMLIIGTSSVQAILSEVPYSKKGICGGVKGGIMPGYYVLESGLAAVGDIFAWFVENFVPARYEHEAEKLNIDIHTFLTRKAAGLGPGESGLLALDWWNGNKTPYVDGDLSGLILGLTLNTKPEEVYRALIESTAYGTNMIMEAFEEAGIEVDEIYACGGIAEKNEMLMQIYADVANREIKISDSSQTAALGAAMYASVAAGEERGGYDTIFDAAKHMSRVKEKTFKPIPENVERYKILYKEYAKLVDYFNPDLNSAMCNIKKLKE